MGKNPFAIKDHSGDGAGSKIGVVTGAKGPGAGALQKAEIDEKNRRIEAVVHALETLLEAGLARDPHVAVGEWRKDPTPDDLPPELREPKVPSRDRFVPAPPSPIARLVPGAGAHHAKAVAAGEAALVAAQREWEQQRERQAAALARLESEVAAHNQAIEARRAVLKAGDPEAVQWYVERVLGKSPYPDVLHRVVKVVFHATANHLNVMLRIPDMAKVVPAIERHRLSKAKGEVAKAKRSPEDRAALGARVVAQIALRTLHEVFTTDDGRAIGSVRLRITSAEPDPETGQTLVTALVTVRVSRFRFEQIDLAHVDPVACLERLKALDGSRAA